IGVVISRDNNLDMLLVLVVLLAAWAVVRATESGRMHWLLLGAALIGVGFNVKMLEAYLVVPALGLLYLLCAPRRWRLRIVHLLLALVVLLIVSFSWMTVVDLTPPSQRPYVGSSQTNSELELALGYNGINRLFHFPAASKPLPERPLHRSSSTSLVLLQAFSASLQASASAVGGNGNNSSPGLLRLFTQPIDGQIAWLLPLALFSLLILVWQRPWRGSLEQGQQALILWGTWLLTMCVALSIAVHFLTYYTVMLAPAISALAGIGLTTLWRDYRNRTQRDWRGWILPFVPFFTGVVQTSFLAPYPLWSAWLSPLILFPAALVGLILLLVRILAFKHRLLPRGARPLALCGALLIVIAPFLWSAVSLTYPASGGGPTAGPREPDLQATLEDLEFSQPFSERTLNANEQMLLSYLSTHRGKTQFLVGTASSSAATPLILVSGQPVMALGGFSGSDPGLTTSQLARDVGNNTIRFFWLTFSVQVSSNASQQ
ncbi:MAG: glycosyltransferase family 39 protein, partial [Ktedonobacteraceae bacterium]